MEGVASQAVADLDSGVADAAAGVNLRGTSIDGADLGSVIVSEAEPRGKPRRLPGFFSIGTTAAGVGCFEFGSSATTEADMSATTCRGAANKICSGCFIAAESGADKVLEIIKCSTAYYKLGAKIAANTAEYVVAIEIINADLDNTLTVKGCNDAACSPAQSTFLLAAKDSAVGYCYQGSSNRIFFGTSGLQNAAGFDFSGKTISNLGTVTTAVIQGGTVAGADITVGNGKTLDVSAGTLTLANAQIPATKVSAGLFAAGTYNFQGSTFTNLGTVNNVDIDAGSIDGATIATSDVTVANGKTLDVAAGTLTLAAGQVAAEKVGAGTFDAGTYNFVGSTLTNGGTVTTVDINGGTIDGTVIQASDITVGNGKTLDVSGGSITLNSGQIPATAIKGGTFSTSLAYNFLGSTITNLGTVTTADINGGTLDGVVIAGATGGFVDITTTSLGVITLGRKVAAKTGNSPDFDASGQAGVQQGVIVSGTSNLASGATVSISMTNAEIVGTTSIIMAVAGGCTGGKPGVINVSPASGSGSITVMNHGTSACSDAFKVYFVIFP